MPLEQEQEFDAEQEQEYATLAWNLATALIQIKSVLL